MNRTQVLRAIKTAKLSHLLSPLRAVMLPAIGITTAPLSARQERALGGSRLGGLPDLPTGSKWPHDRLAGTAGGFLGIGGGQLVRIGVAERQLELAPPVAI